MSLLAGLGAALALWLAPPRTLPPRGAVRAAQRLYRACMDQRRIAALGNAPLQPELHRLGAIRTPRQLAQAVAGLHGYGIFVLFSYGPPPRHDPPLPVSALLPHMQRDFALAGDTNRQAEREARAALRLALALTPLPPRAAAALARPAYVPLRSTSLQRLAPRFDWAAYFAARPRLPPGAHPGDTAQLETLNRLLRVVPPAAWRAYLRWEWIHAVADWLSPPFVTEEFRYAKLLEHIGGGQPSRAEFCRAESTQFYAHDFRAAELRGGGFFDDMLRLRAVQASHQLW